MFCNIYKGKKVFITGNTGFKGSWLALWLLSQGANVVGYSKDIPTHPSHYKILDLDYETISSDVLDLEKLRESIRSFNPDIVFHLAAQSIVRKSYLNPVETFETNVIGTANVFEACRSIESVRAIVNVTSDKCYENREWTWGYRENDRVGGHDPYSASKGCSELVTTCYQRSFFPPEEYMKTHQTLVASVRAGNVVGGGDWAEDRLVPDIMRASSQNTKVQIRNPHAIRPWQHVLEPLSGYLLLGQLLLEGVKDLSGAWNFGPADDGHRDVLSVIKELQKHWPKIDYRIKADERDLHEATLLWLDCSKSHAKLKWRPVWDSHAALAKTAHWYMAYYESELVLSEKQLAEYITDARQKQILWANQ